MDIINWLINKGYEFVPGSITKNNTGYQFKISPCFYHIDECDALRLNERLMDIDNGNGTTWCLLYNATDEETMSISMQGPIED
ncbi:hypothetical protein A6U96_13945 [Agrobacterium tumefaciens]|nr:hypothetical protein A6U96_13945 [Agrobacterium tumefaciens]